jgi:MFS family permease
MRIQPQFLMLMAVVMISPMGIDLYLAMMPIMQKELDISVSQAQMTINVYVLTIGAAQIVLGPIADQYGRKLVAVLGLFIFCIASSIIVFAHDYTIILAMRMLQGIGACSATIVAFSSARDQFKPSELIHVMSYLSASITIIPSIAPILGGALAYVWGWRACFVFMAVYTGLLLISFIAKYQETCPSIGQQTKLYSFNRFRPMLVDHQFKKYAFIAMMCMTNILVYVNFVPDWMMNHLQQPASMFIFSFSLNAVCSMLACLLTPYLSNRFGIHTLIKSGFIAQVAIGLAMVTTQWLLPNHLMVFSFLALCFAISFAWTMSPVISLVLMPFKMAAGTAQALLGFIQSGGAFVVICGLQTLDWLPIHVLSFMLILQGLLAVTLLNVKPNQESNLKKINTASTLKIDLK